MGPSTVATDVAPDDGELAESDIHDVLRNDRRRLAIDCLQDAEERRLDVRDLSEQVAALETGEDPPPRDTRQSVYVSLHQTHLPKLDDLGIVTYDGDDKQVSLRERVEEVEVYMEVVPRYGLSWGEFYFGLALLGLLTTTGVAIGVPGLSNVGISGVAGLFFVITMIASAYHVYSQQDRFLFDRVRS